MVIAVVALIVIGPEKLPRVARTMGLLAGRLQRYVASVKSDISREIQLEELKKLEQEVRQNATQVESNINQQFNELSHLSDPTANNPASIEPPPDTKQ